MVEIALVSIMVVVTGTDKGGSMVMVSSGNFGTGHGWWFLFLNRRRIEDGWWLDRRWILRMDIEDGY